MNSHSHFNLSYTAGLVVGKVVHAGPFKRAWEAARPVRRAARHVNLSYAAGFVVGKVFHPVSFVVGKVVHSGPVKRAWEAARPVRRALRLVKIGVLYPFDWLFFGGIGVLWRTREEWREIFRDALENGKPLPNFHLDAVEEEVEFSLPGNMPGSFAGLGDMIRADEDGIVMYSDPSECFRRF